MKHESLIMYKKVIRIIFFVLVSLFLLLTTQYLLSTTVHAEERVYTMLEPIPLSDPAGAPDTTTTASKFFQGIVPLIIALAGALAVLMIIIGGIQYMSTDAIGEKSEGKERIRNAIGGFILIISAWLILYTVNPKLIEFNLSIPSAKEGAVSISTNNIECAGGRVVIKGVSFGMQWPPSGGSGSTDEDNRLLFRNNNVRVNSSDCTTIGQCNCTSLYDMTNKMVDGIVNLSRECQVWNNNIPCNIWVSGGTEYWLHGTGNTEENQNNTQHKPASFGAQSNRAIDLSKNTQLRSFLRQKGTPGSSDCATGIERYDHNGATYIYENSRRNANGIIEGTHWHVCFR
jgi:hypothetical protein